jgi:hypothetical protein
VAGIPLAAAVREGPDEPFGQPWRLVYLGDPLYRLNVRDPTEGGATTLDRENPFIRVDPIQWVSSTGNDHGETDLVSLPVHEVEQAVETSNIPAQARLRRCLDSAIAELCGSDQQKARPANFEQRADEGWRPILESISREELEVEDRRIWDALVIHAIPTGGRELEETRWCRRLQQIPVAEWSPKVEAILEYWMTHRIASADSAGDTAATLAVWDEAMRRPWPVGSDFPAQITERARPEISNTSSLRQWRDHLREAFARTSADPATRAAASVIADELRRVQTKLSSESATR